MSVYLRNRGALDWVSLSGRRKRSAETSTTVTHIYLRLSVGFFHIWNLQLVSKLGFYMPVNLDSTIGFWIMWTQAHPNLLLHLELLKLFSLRKEEGR